MDHKLGIIDEQSYEETEHKFNRLPSQSVRKSNLLNLEFSNDPVRMLSTNKQNTNADHLPMMSLRESDLEALLELSQRSAQP